MCKISVLMSVYNESERELNESISSVLSQTYKNFEFIIVNDNPENKKLKVILERWSNKDTRINILNNKENIGLAMSLNKAAKVAKGKYLARMDADDIAIENRFQLQLDYLEKNADIDLICSNFYFIDDCSKIINREFVYLSKTQLRKLLPIWNTIHHPTVMMKKTSFTKVGGYRNFPCAQDYDLWLRMLTSNFEFYMLHDKLLKYRIRDNSTTSSKRLLQVLTMNYIKALYKERLKNNTDSYSETDYQNYLEKKNYYNDDYIKNLMEKRKLFKNIQKDIKNKNYIKSIWILLYLLFGSSYFRNRLCTVLEFQLKRFLTLVLK